jgi:ABC-type protease/lipase transport system fused ATPase/permease subunit
VDTILDLQKILNLLTTAVKFTFPDLPYQPLYYRVYLLSLPLALLGLLILVQEA